MRLARVIAFPVLILCLMVPAGTVAAQGTAPPRVVTPALDFSGVIYANWQRRTDSASMAANGGEAASKFDVERVYLNFRLPAGDRASIRVTTDVFNGDQSGTSYYKGWTVRVKYAYLQWNFANNIAGVDGLNATTRFGMLNNVIIDHEESYWARYLSQTAVERTAGFFSSSDLGAALLVTLPNKMGEVYSTVMNGPGYTAAENDRFKDVAARLTLTPLANSNALGAWSKTLAISPWIYSGRTASRFQNGGGVGGANVPEGLSRARYGVFAGARDPRFTLGASFGQRTEDVEPPGATAADPRTENTGGVTSVFAIARPGRWVDSTSWVAKWGVLGRLDSFKPNTDTDPSNQLTIISLFYEPTPRVTFSLDAQSLTRKNGSNVLETKGLFFHIQALF